MVSGKLFNLFMSVSRLHNGENTINPTYLKGLKEILCKKALKKYGKIDPSGMQIRLFADLSISMFGFSTSVPKKDLCIKIDLVSSTEYALPSTLICFSFI